MSELRPLNRGCVTLSTGDPVLDARPDVRAWLDYCAREVEKDLPPPVACAEKFIASARRIVEAAIWRA